MHLVKITLLVFIWVFETASQETDNLSISEDNVTWQDATNSGHTLLSSHFVSSHGWDSISTYLLQKSLHGTRYWIGARATYTSFLSWTGCVNWTGDQECGELLPGGSIGDCIQNCGEAFHYFLLKDSSCRCVHRNYTDCFNYTYDRCDRSCPNNPNDWCGGPGHAMSLYYTGPFYYPMLETNDTDKNCAVLIESGQLAEVTQFQPEHCGKKPIRRYICKDKSLVSPKMYDTYLGWFEAHEQCRLSGHQFHYYLKKLDRSIFWTSLRRSILLKWTDKQDTDAKFPHCVSVSGDNYTVSLHEEPCDQKHQYLYLEKEYRKLENSIHINNQTWWRWWYPLLSVIVLVPLLLIVLRRVVLYRKRVRNVKRMNAIQSPNAAIVLETIATDTNERMPETLPEERNNEELMNDSAEVTKSSRNIVEYTDNKRNVSHDMACSRASECTSSSNNEYVYSVVIKKRKNCNEACLVKGSDDFDSAKSS